MTSTTLTAAAPQIFVLNGWAAAQAAWQGCHFRRDAIFSYRDHLDGTTRAAFDSSPAKLVLAGWSMGAMYALELAIRHPEKVASLLLLAPAARMMKDENWPGMTPRRLEALALGLKITLSSGGSAAAAYEPDTEENLNRGLDYLRATDLRAALLQSRAALAHIPAFIFQSAGDAVVKAHNAGFIASIFPSATLEIVPGAEHALPTAIPERIDEAMEKLLSALCA